MKKVAILIKDFRLATKIVESIANLGYESFFPDPNQDYRWKADIIIVDLDYEKNRGFNQIRQCLESQTEVEIIGYAKRVSKSLRNEAIEAGCKWIFSKSSLYRNISSLLTSINP
mgnify:FL=1|tara:strand:- start:281 stop:622 length:342 start_codon:yes stop_codon:yes gene_type:complete